MKIILIQVLFIFISICSYSQTNYCSYDTSEVTGNYYEYLQGYYENDSEVDKIINSIASSIGLEKNFISVNSQGLNNCVALNYEGFRFILYDKNYLNILSQNKSKKSSIYFSVLSHEIGHHLQGHTLKNISESDNKLSELEADKFSGYIMAKFGYTLTEAKEAIQATTESYSTTHPLKHQRLKAIEDGYKEQLYKINKGINQIENNLYVKYFTEGQINLRNKEFEKASENFTTAITLNKSNNFFPICFRAISYSEAKYYKQAIKDYEKLEKIKIDDNKVLANYLYFNRGVTYEEMEENGSASKDFLKAYELNPSDKISLMKFAVNQSLAGNYTSSLLAFEFQLSDSDINNSELQNFTKGDIFLQKAISYFEVNETDNAIKYFNIAFQLYPKEYPKLALPSFYKGNIYLKTKQYDKAISNYLEFIDIYNQEQTYLYFDLNYNRIKEVYYNLAQVYQNQKKYTLSNQYINKLIQLVPNFGQAYFLRGVNSYENKDLEKAKNDFTKSCELGFNLGCETNESYGNSIEVVKENNKTLIKTEDVSNPLNKSNSDNILGGYTTTKIYEYKSNGKSNGKNEWVLEKELDVNSKVFLNQDIYYFQRGENHWKQAKWTFSGFDDKSQRYFFYDDYGQTVAIDKEIKSISWFFNRNAEGIPQNLIIYKTLRKDKNVIPE